MQEYSTEVGNTTIHFGNGLSHYLPFHTNEKAIAWAKSMTSKYGGWFTYTID